MRRKDFLTTVSGAVNSGDLNELAKVIIDNLDRANSPSTDLLRQMFEAGIALGQADAAKKEVPASALELMQLMATNPIAPKAFKALRQQLGISQESIAELCNISQATFSYHELSEGPMPPEAIHALMKLAFDKIPKNGKQEDIISGATMYKLRKMLGIRQVDLAEMLGVSKQTVEAWEREPEKPLTAKMVQRIRPLLEALIARADAAIRPQLQALIARADAAA